MDVLEAGVQASGSQGGPRRVVRLLAVVAVVIVAGAVLFGAARWWTERSARPERLEILALDAIGPFAIAGDDLPEGWPEDLVAPAVRLRAEIAGDPQRSTRVLPAGETAAYVSGGMQETVIPAGERIEVDMVLTPADCSPGALRDPTSPLVDASAAAVPMTPEASRALVTVMDSLCSAGGVAPIISTTAARIDVFFRDRTLIMRLRVTTAADRVVLQPRDSVGFRGAGAVEATIEDGAASARLRWLVSPAEAMTLEEPTVRLRAFGITGGRAYPWVLELRVPDVRVTAPASPTRNDGVDLAEVAPRPSG